MRLDTPALFLPKYTPHIVVDPLEDFTEGAFVDCYGVPDTEPIREVVANLDAMTEEWRDNADLILCRSQYKHDQFGVPGLERLCTTEEGRRSVIDPQRFSRSVCKFDNSLLSADVDFDELIGDNEFFGVEGLTTTSCVIKTIDGCRDRMRDRTIILPENAVGVRKARTADGQKILAQLSDPDDKRVIVVPKWEQIQHRN
jgi:hypothetical protein